MIFKIWLSLFSYSPETCSALLVFPTIGEEWEAHHPVKGICRSNPLKIVVSHFFCLPLGKGWQRILLTTSNMLEIAVLSLFLKSLKTWAFVCLLPLDALSPLPHQYFNLNIIEYFTRGENVNACQSMWTHVNTCQRKGKRVNKRQHKQTHISPSNSFFTKQGWWAFTAPWQYMIDEINRNCLCCTGINRNCLC